MLVSLPIVLLLLDYWPLKRLGSPIKLVLEKLPLFGLALLSCATTLIAQRGSMLSIVRIPVPLRLENALVSYVDYLRQMFWPVDLTVLYPWEASRLGVFRVVGSAIVLVGISAVVLILRRRGYLLTGWLWYLVMLIPVIGIIQVGDQARADRYTYLPQIGISLLLTWAVVDLSISWAKRRVWLAAFGTVILTGLIFLSHAQAAYWRDSETLWSHSLACTTDNVTAEVLLAEAYHAQGKRSEAMAHFERALVIEPRQAQVHSSLGVLFGDGAGKRVTGPSEKGLGNQTRLWRCTVPVKLGNTYVAMREVKEALSHYSKAIEIDPNDVEASAIWRGYLPPGPMR